MLNLVDVIEAHYAELIARLGDIPDAAALIHNLKLVLAGKPEKPWFPAVASEKFLKAMATIEEVMLSHMSWEVESDPVVRAHARALLRQGLARLTRNFAARLDREVNTLQTRLQTTKDQLCRQDALLEALQTVSFSGLAIVTAEGVIITWNDEATSITHIPASSAIGHSVHALLPGVSAAMSSFTADDLSAPPGWMLEGDCTSTLDPATPTRFRIGLLKSCPGPHSGSFVLSFARGSDTLS